jgi:hypothetical protein
VTSGEKAKKGERIYRQCWPYWNGLSGRSPFWPDWNGVEWRKLLLARLEWLGMEEVGFGLSGMAWNGGCRYWPDWNGLEWSRFWPVCKVPPSQLAPACYYDEVRNGTANHGQGAGNSKRGPIFDRQSSAAKFLIIINLRGRYVHKYMACGSQTSWDKGSRWWW